MPCFQWLVPCSLAIALSTTVAAQGHVWVVDDTSATNPDFPNIQAAIDSPLVVDGDVVLIKAGTYTQSLNLTTGKALTLQADAGAAVVVDGFTVNIASVPDGKSVSLRGLTFLHSYGMALTNCQGTVWLETCTIRADPGG